IQNNRALIKANGLVEHTFEVRDRASSLLMLLSSFDFDERRSSLAGNEEVEKTLERHEDEIQRAADMLGVLVADDAGQATRMALLEKALRAKFASLKRTADDRRGQEMTEQKRLELLRKTDEGSSAI